MAVEGVGGTGTLTGVTSLVSDGDGYCALLTSGGVDCWGNGADGELGNGIVLHDVKGAPPPSRSKVSEEPGHSPR